MTRRLLDRTFRTDSGYEVRWATLGEGSPGARLHLIEGAGHLVQEDAPAELTAALADFLRPGGAATARDGG
ncbi:hypothetical protein JCM4914_23340 [Streptomyces platensis subsp. malvinus]